MEIEYGKLTVYVGPMFAGKSTKLLKEITWLQYIKEHNFVLLKPSFDNRYSENEVVTHDGHKVVAKSIYQPPLFKLLPKNIFIDEMQFFEKPNYEGNFVEEMKKYLKLGVNIFCSGLDTDWQGNPFSVSASFIAMADEVIKLTSKCSVCGMPASKTFKKYTNEKSVELGSTDLYEARCNLHWKYD